MFKIEKCISDGGQSTIFFVSSTTFNIPSTLKSSTHELFTNPNKFDLDLDVESIKNISLPDGNLYVLKIISSSEDEAEKEIRILKKLRHPNIINLKSAIYFDQQTSILFDFMKYSDMYNSMYLITYYTTPKFFEQLANACKYCNENGIIHADIKSENILIDNNMNPILTDFGLSIEISKGQDFVIAKKWVGTEYFFAPEIFKIKRYSSKSDIWAFGATLYESVHKKHPFAKTDVQFEKESIYHRLSPFQRDRENIWFK
jgi:serine/threonine protein kinase